jgi:hypothetical protein
MCISGTASATDGGGSTGSGSDGGGSGSGSSKSGGCAVTGGDTSFANILVPLGLASLFSLAMRGKKKKQA